MFKLKIFLKTSTKKLKRLSVFKEKGLKSFLYFLKKERNKHFDVINKHMLIFIRHILSKLDNNNTLMENLMSNLFVKNIECLNSKSLKRLNIRAKGRADILTKKNSYLVITVSLRKTLNYLRFYEKNYLINIYGKKN